MLTTTDFATFQQQLRQEMAHLIQQFRVEENESISGGMDMLNSMNTPLQKVSAKPTDSKSYRISDLIPRNWKGSNEKPRIPKLHVRLALVDASVVKSRRK